MFVFAIPCGKEHTLSFFFSLFVLSAGRTFLYQPFFFQSGWACPSFFFCDYLDGIIQRFP
jgi:hypothetical protein